LHSGGSDGGFLPRRYMDEIGGEVGRLQPEIDPVADAREGARDDDVVLDMLGGDPEHPGSALQLRVDVRVDHPLLLAEPFVRLRFAQSLDLVAAHDLPIRFAGPAGGGQRLRVILGNSQFVDVLAEPDIGRPAGELGAACDIKYRHRLLAFSRRNKSLPAAVTTPLLGFRQPPGFPDGIAAMPMLIGSTTVFCTLLSMMLGQIAMGMEAIGVVLAALVLMSVQRE
jgi:hypothetical protein